MFKLFIIQYMLFILYIYIVGHRFFCFLFWFLQIQMMHNSQIPQEWSAISTNKNE